MLFKNGPFTAASSPRKKQLSVNNGSIQQVGLFKRGSLLNFTNRLQQEREQLKNNMYKQKLLQLLAQKGFAAFLKITE